jgi:transporter family protein
MKDWFIFAMLALVLYGLWGFFPKIASNYIGPKSILIYETIGAVLVGILVLFLLSFKVEINSSGALFGILTGIAATAGTLFFLFALTKGKVSVIVTTTALYPLVTIILAFLILKEPITPKQGIGMVLALIAMALMAI